MGGGVVYIIKGRQMSGDPQSVEVLFRQELLRANHSTRLLRPSAPAMIFASAIRVSSARHPDDLDFKLAVMTAKWE